MSERLNPYKSAPAGFKPMLDMEKYLAES